MAMLRKLVLGGINMNRGSVTIMAIGVMMFLGIILSGVLPMITQEVRSGTMNRDVVEAQYAAEAGLKRTIAAMQAESTDWAWIGTPRSFSSDAGKIYTVSLQNDSPQSLINGDKPSSGWYYLQSEGKVNNAIKKTMVKVRVIAGGGSLTGVYANGVFGTAAINMNNSTINGSAGTNTTFSGWNSTINGDLSAVVDNNSRSIWQKVNVTGTTTDDTSTPPAVAVDVPTFSTSFTMPSAPNVAGALAWPVAQSMWKESGVTIPSGVYKLTGQWTAGQSTVSVQPSTSLYATSGIRFDNKSEITMGADSTLYSGAGLTVESNGAKLTTQANTTFYVVNQMALGNSAIVTMGDKAVLCIGGGLKLDNGSVLTTQGKTTIYVNGDLELANGGTAINFGGDTELFIGGRLILSNPSQISTAANSNVVIKANSISMANSSSISSGTGSSLAILAETTITMSNTASIENALVMAKGNISIQGGSISGAVISTGAVVTMDGATATYDPTMVSRVLLNNPGLGTGGGATSISTSEWKNY